MALQDPINSLDVIRGSSKTLALTVLDETGAPVDLTGARVIFTVKSSPTDGVPLVQKDSNVPTQVGIDSPRTGEAKIYLQPADTHGMDPIEYIFDVWVVLASGKRYPVVQPSIFRIKPGVTVLAL